MKKANNKRATYIPMCTRCEAIALINFRNTFGTLKDRSARIKKLEAGLKEGKKLIKELEAEASAGPRNPFFEPRGKRHI